LKIYGTEITPLRNREAIKRLEREDIEAFIFNSSTHWFALRRLDGIWFNLNSTNSFPGPEIISDFYLSAFIQGTEDVGYSNFMIRNLPPLQDLKSGVYQNLQPYQKLVTIDEVIKAKESKKIKKDEEKKEEKEKEDDNKFKPFSGKGYQMSETKDNKNELLEGDDEMKQAYELSLQEYLSEVEKILPEEPQDGYNIILKYNDNTFSRKFREDNRICVC
jgi:hypothetical protein